MALIFAQLGCSDLKFSTARKYDQFEQILNTKKHLKYICARNINHQFVFMKLKAIKHQRYVIMKYRMKKLDSKGTCVNTHDGAIQWNALRRRHLDVRL